MTTNNQFDFMQSFANQEHITRMMKMFPNMDNSSFSEAMKKNSEAFMSASQMVIESVQSVAKRSSDAFQKNATEMFNSMKDAISAGDIEQVAACQQKYIKSTVDNNLNNTKEILDIASKSSKEVLEVFGKNISENMGKSFTQKASKAGK